MFITNVFFIPFMALRAAPEPLQPAAAGAAAQPQPVPLPGSQRLPGWSPVLGGLGVFMGEWPRGVAGRRAQPRQGLTAMRARPTDPAACAPRPRLPGGLCIYWALAGRPELGGDLAARWGYLQATLSTNRVFWAFFLDMGLFYVWQLSFMRAAPAYKWVPYFGLAAWLLAGGTRGGDDEQHS